MGYKKGHKFGHWEFLGERGGMPGERTMLCRCKCGKEQFVRGCNLCRGTTTQCLDCSNEERRELAKIRTASATIHSPFKRAWRRVEHICLWKSYEAFYSDVKDVDIKKFPYPKRWNILKPYSKNNIFFSTRHEQRPSSGSAMESGRFAWFNREWASALGISKERVRQLRCDGMTIEEMRERFGCTDDKTVIERVLKANQ